MNADENLARLQRWFQAAMTQSDINSHEPATEPAALNEVLTRSRSLTAEQRFAVYQHAYAARLLECLTAEFPATAATLGEEAFRPMAREYLCEFPSRSFTLARLGSDFPNFLRSIRPPRAEAEPDFADMVIELAELERIYAEVFDERGPETTQTASDPVLSAPNLAAWENSCLVAFPCVRQLRFAFPVHELCTAVRKGEAFDFPEPRTTHLVVTRRDYVVRRLEMSSSQAAVLSELLAGKTIGDSIASVVAATNNGPAFTPAELQEWFRQWWLLPVFSGVSDL